MKTILLLPVVVLPFIMLFTSCDKDKDGSVTDINLFSVNDDIKLGQQVVAEIDANPIQYPQLDSASNVAVYNYLYNMRNEILAGNDVAFRDRFEWRLRIIRDDNTLNAFCTPGGYIYIYTGLIKFLDSASQLAGVLGHEIAHADKRHSTDALTRQYGIQVLFAIVLGNNQGTLTQIAQNILGLGYSRNNESQADEFSVKYLCGTGFNADGAAGFFQKLLDQNQGNCDIGGFLSTHPCPENRVQNIRQRNIDLVCGSKQEPAAPLTYAAFKALLPN